MKSENHWANRFNKIREDERKIRAKCNHLLRRRAKLSKSGRKLFNLQCTLCGVSRRSDYKTEDLIWSDLIRFDEELVVICKARKKKLAEDNKAARLSLMKTYKRGAHWKKIRHLKSKEIHGRCEDCKVKKATHFWNRTIFLKFEECHHLCAFCKACSDARYKEMRAPL